MQITEKRQYILLFLFFVMPVFMLYGQRVILSAYQQDSVRTVQQDSLNKVKHVQDSLATVYIFDQPNRPNYWLDSIRAEVVVNNNDFVSWIEFSNTLRKDDVTAKISSPNKYVRPAWVFFVILLLYIGIGLIRLFFYSTFQGIIYGFFNERILMQISKEDSMLTSWPYIFLYAIFSLAMGLFIVIQQSAFSASSPLTILYFLKISAFVAVLFVVKILLIRIISVIFEIERLAREYITVLYLVYFNSMLLLMPMLLFVTFLPVFYFKFILIFYVIIVSLLFLYRFLRTAWSLLGNLRFSIFYLILYLCTLEVIPILILVKALNK